MATIGVLTYTLPAGLKLKNTSFNKATFGTVDGSSGGNNTIVTKIPDLGMIGNEVMVMRKKSKLIPLLDSNAKNIQQEPAAKKLKLSDSNSNVSVTKSIGSVAGCKKSTPLPQAVARRNARERNRVKQVNNGFAALRQHIPDEIAEAFEAAGNGRGSAKKLSKVETLRMAVEYIRSLERLLELDNLSDSEMSISSPTKTVIKSEMSYTPTLEDEFNDSNTDTDEKIAYITDILPDITTVNGQQYIRIPGTNTYQLITSEMFENEENIQPPTATSYPDGGLQAGLAFTLTTTAQEVSPTIAPAPISADRFGGGNGPSLLSPVDHLQQHQLLSQLQMQQHVRIKSQDISSLFPNQLAPSSPPISEGPGFTDVQLYETPTHHQFKREIKEEIILEQATLSEESMMEAIDWWGANTPQSDDSVIL